MTPIIFSEFAASDLEDIVSYFAALSDATLANIQNDINAVLSRLSDYPESGTVFIADRRRAISPKYRFVIDHVLHPQHIEILGI